MAALRSSLNPRLTNEFKVQYMYSYKTEDASELLQFSNIPRAIVNATSPFPTEANPNATQTKSVQFGGQRFSPESNRMKQVHLSNTAYWNTDKINFTFGTDNMLTYIETYLSSEQNGRFFFNNLNDLAALLPTATPARCALKGAPIVEQTVLGHFRIRAGRVQSAPRSQHRAVGALRRIRLP